MSEDLRSTEREISAAIELSLGADDRALILAGRGPGVVIANAIHECWPNQTTVLAEVCDIDTNTFVQMVARAVPDLVIGIGGGSVIERMKVAAQMSEATSMAVPTSMSQDGLFAPSAVLKQSDGSTKRYSCSVPTMVIPARSLIDAAPEWTRAACIADLLSNLSAVADCELSIRNGRGGPPAEALDLAARSARLAAQSDPSAGAMALFESVEMSGRAMAVSGDSRPCSGAEHKIAHAIDLVTGRTMTHGLSVGVASVFVAHLRDDAHHDEMLDAFVRHQLPMRPDQIDLTPEAFVEAVLLAGTQRRDRFTVLDVAELDADSIRRILGSEVYA